MLILCKAWAPSRRLCDVQNEVGVAFVSVWAAWVSILVLEKQDFSLFWKKKRRKEKKGHANFSSVFLEGNGRCVGLDSFFFLFHSPHPPTSSLRYEQMIAETSDRLQLWLRSAGSNASVLLFCDAALSRASGECRVEENIAAAFDCIFYFPPGFPSFSVLPVSWLVQKGDASSHTEDFLRF